jgi:hypothetical protein
MSGWNQLQCEEEMNIATHEFFWLSHLCCERIRDNLYSSHIDFDSLQSHYLCPTHIRVDSQSI